MTPGRAHPVDVTCREVVGPDDLAAHHRIRHAVFVDEQRIFPGSDQDGHDRSRGTIHLVAAAGGEVVGAVRCYPRPDATRWQGDRLAVDARFRDSGVAALLVAGALGAAATRGATEMVAYVQLPNVAFFERLGWTPSPEGPVPYAGRPHQPMWRALAAPVTTIGTVLIYDGDCGFCTVSARWAARRLPPGTRVLPWQEIPDLSAYGLTVEHVTSAAYWVGSDGHTHRGERAVAAGLVAMGGPWALAGRVLGAPPAVWLAGPWYRLVARYRHRMPGGTAACRLPRE